MQCSISKEKTMGIRPMTDRIADFIGVFGSAVAVSRCVEARRRPDPSDLRRIGINPEDFYRIGRS